MTPKQAKHTGMTHHPSEHRFPLFEPGQSGTTSDTYRIAAYTDGLVGASPSCDVLKPHWDSGLKWGSAANPQPGDWCWGAGVAGGVKWAGTFYRDQNRFGDATSPQGATIRSELFWCSYLKPGSAPGMKNGYWINFGSGWSHLHNDDPAQILGGASQKLFWDPVAAFSERFRSESGATTGQWKLVIEATMFVTVAVVDVWTGTKTGGNDPAGTYSRISGLDPIPTLNVEAV